MTNSNINKTFRRFNCNGTTLVEFVIKKEKYKTRKIIEHEDGSTSPEYTSLYVSDGSSAWFGVYKSDCEVV